MKVSNPVPNEIITDYVQRVLVIENYEVTNPFTLPLFANGSPTLLFQTTNGTIDNEPTNTLTLFGQTVFPRTLTIKDNFILIAYFFKPIALSALFGVSAQELTDNPIALELLAPKITDELKDKLLNAGSIQNMIHLLDNYILSLIVKNKVTCQLTAYAVNKIAGNTSRKSLTLVQKDLYITERTFQRLFKNNIGLPPDLYRRICQFNTAFQQLNKRQFYRLSDIAFENGYADQSHYIRAFKEFTYITPKDYLKFAASS